MQFDCCGVDDDGYKMYLKAPNATDKEAFPQSCCVPTGNLTCPKTIGQAKKADPKVFKTKVRKMQLAKLIGLFYQYYVDAVFDYVFN